MCRGCKEKVSLTPLYYPDTLINPDTCLKKFCQQKIEVLFQPKTTLCFTVMIQSNFRCPGKEALPEVGWQLDSFGHSLTQAKIFHAIGYKAVFFQRYHFAEKRARFQNGTQIFQWQLSPNTSLLTLTFDQYTSQGPFQYDGHWNHYVMPTVSDILEYIHNMPLVKNAHLKNVFILLGGDFQYMKAEGNFHRADQLIQKINLHNTSDVYLTYSTPSCYLEAIKNEKWTSRSGDFMPYISSK